MKPVQQARCYLSVTRAEANKQTHARTLARTSLRECVWGVRLLALVRAGVVMGEYKRWWWIEPVGPGRSLTHHPRLRGDARVAAHKEVGCEGYVQKNVGVG
jgi:hypothetical protein